MGGVNYQKKGSPLSLFYKSLRRLRSLSYKLILCREASAEAKKER